MQARFSVLHRSAAVLLQASKKSTLISFITRLGDLRELLGETSESFLDCCYYFGELVGSLAVVVIACMIHISETGGVVLHVCLLSSRGLFQVSVVPTSFCCWTNVFTQSAVLGIAHEDWIHLPLQFWFAGLNCRKTLLLHLKKSISPRARCHLHHPAILPLTIPPYHLPS